MTYFRIFIIKTETKTEHQIIRGMEILKIVADVKEWTPGDVDLQRKDLIQSAQIATSQHIRSQANTEG